MSTPHISKVRAILLGLICAAAPLTPAARAIDFDNAVIVNIPFAFQDGTKHFSAGLYRIGVSSEGLAVIRGNSDGGYATTWFDRDPEPSKTSKVVFRKFGDKYFIDEIFIQGQDKHTYFRPSKHEEEEMSSTAGPRTNVVVAALEPPH
jgi:hypothetical protein